jgi:hypothetical protein
MKGGSTLPLGCSTKEPHPLYAIHLARFGRLAWASTQFLMYGRIIMIGQAGCQFLSTVATYFTRGFRGARVVTNNVVSPAHGITASRLSERQKIWVELRGNAMRHALSPRDLILSFMESGPAARVNRHALSRRAHTVRRGFERDFTGGANADY